MEDGVSVCSNCGASIKTANEPSQEAVAVPEAAENAKAETPSKTDSVSNGKKLPQKKFLIGGVAGTVILIVMIAAVVLQPKK